LIENSGRLDRTLEAYTIDGRENLVVAASWKFAAGFAIILESDGAVLPTPFR